MIARRLLAAAALALALSGGGAAHAQSAADVAAARELFREGARFASQNDWEKARDRYERSLKLKRAAITLYSLGVAYKTTGKLVEALESFRGFLAEPLTDATRPYERAAREAIAELERRVATIDVKVQPLAVTGLVIRLDGEEVPSVALDRPRLVDPGVHELTASAPGYRPARGSATVGEGGAATVNLRLEPEAAAVAPPAPPPPVAPLAARSAPDVGAEAPSRALPIGLIGGGAAALGAGIAVGLVGVGQAEEAPTSDGPEASSGRTKAIVGDVVAGAGIVAIGVGIVVLIVQATGPSSARAPGSGRAAAPPGPRWSGARLIW